MTMSNVKEADRCIKNLNHSVLEGRVITVEKVNLGVAFLNCTICIFRMYTCFFSLFSENNGALF